MPPQSHPHPERRAAAHGPTRRRLLPWWGFAALPLGLVGGAALGSVTGAAFGNVIIGLGIGTGLGLGTGVAVMAAAAVFSASQ